MTRACRDVLNQLRALSRSDYRVLTYVSDAPRICALDDMNQYYDYTKYRGEFGAIIQELAKEGYLEQHSQGVQFWLTYKGLHPYGLAWEEFKPRFFWSVLVPIFVSIVTTLITVHATALIHLQ